MSNQINNVLVVEGGALRSVFSAGLLDGFLDNTFNPFDCYIGVSAGASNLITYMSETPGKSINAILNLALKKEFISYSRFLFGGHLIDLDWLFKTIFSENHLDLDKVYRHGKSLYVCTTDVNTGKAVYTNTNMENLVPVIKASTALPVLYRGFPTVNGHPMTDGGVADGIPVSEALRIGGKRIMVIRSRPKNYIKQDTLGHKYIRWKLRKYPLLTKKMRARVKIHSEAIGIIRNPPPGVEIMEVCPPESFNIGRFSRNRINLLQGYEAGFTLAHDTINRWTSMS